MISKSFGFLFAILLTTAVSQAQIDFKPQGNIYDARGYFKYQNFRFSLQEYLELLKKDSNNLEYRYKIGQCYLYTNIDKSKAIKYLEWVVKQPKADASAWYDLGRAYQLAYRFDDAKKAYQKFLTLTNKDDNYIPAKKQIEQCEYAKKLMTNPIPVKFDLLPAPINSDGPDYYPYVAPDESFLMFTSKRKGNTGNFLDFDGYLTPDIYVTKRDETGWGKPKNVGSRINTYLNEETAGLSPDGKKAFFFFANELGKADIFMADVSVTGNNVTFSKPESLGSYVNTDNYEGGSTISPDGNMLIFASSRPDGIGGMDLYMSFRLPNGSWGKPINLGKDINTQYDEDYPYFAPDGKTFFFCSNGHPGMGGYDIYKCSYDAEKKTFSKPVNLGYPVNTPDDEYTISFTQSMRYAYISTYRPFGIGDLDIYRVTFLNTPQKPVLIKGYVVCSDSTEYFKKRTQLEEMLQTYNKMWDSIVRTYPPKTKPEKIEKNHDSFLQTKKSVEEKLKKLPKNLSIRLYKAETKELYGIYKVAQHSSKFIMVIDPGEYRMEITIPGLDRIEKTISIPDMENPPVPAVVKLVVKDNP